jgi:hypothetical protein
MILHRPEWRSTDLETAEILTYLILQFAGRWKLKHHMLKHVVSKLPARFFDPERSRIVSFWVKGWGE